ncbi:MAG: amidohydrolase [Bacteroidota bacterium]
MPRLLACLLLLSCATACSTPAAPPSGEAPPTNYVLHNASIYTVDAAKPSAEALAVSNGAIVGVGAADSLLAAHPEWARLDAGGATVVPGLIDAHAHLMGMLSGEGLGQLLLNVNLAGTRSVEEIVDRLVSHATTLSGEAWLVGRGWDQNDWAPADDGSYPFPTRADLDEAIPNRPVLLERIDGHAYWANTAALREAGIDPGAPAPTNPEGGAYIRDQDGLPTGVTIDKAGEALQAAVPPISDEQKREALRRALAETAKYGLTGIHEAGTSLEAYRLYEQAIRDGQFGLRLYAMASGAGDAMAFACDNEGRVTHPSGRLQMRSVKLYLDGALGSRGAALIEDYADDPGNRGLLFLQPEAFAPIVQEAMDCGLQVNTHAIGDRANRVVLDAYEQAMASQSGREGPGNQGRHRIEHAQVATPDDLDRLVDLGVIASMQPTHATSDMPWAEDRVGPVRIRGAYAWRTIVDAGGRLALGSDFPVERVDPILGFYAAVARQDAEGIPEGGWYPDQRLTREEALRGFTLDAAYAAFMEDEVGSLEVGKRADFVLLNQDLMTVPVEDLLSTRVLATYLDGARIYEADAP